MTQDEGGRHKPFFTGYRPQCFVRTADVPAKITIPGDTEEEAKMVMPGDNIELEFELEQPLVVAKGLRFALREGGKTVSAGIVINVEE